MNYSSYNTSRYLPSLSESSELGKRTLDAISCFFNTSDKTLKVLEVGCASGSFLKTLQNKQFENVQGIDLDRELVSHGKTVLGVNVVVADWNTFMLEDGEKFDLIVALDVLEHIAPSDLPELLKNTHKRLSSRGKLILRTPNPDCPFVLPTFCGDLTHKTLITSELITFLLREANFNGAIKIKETVPHNKFKRYIYNIMHYIIIKPIISIFHFHFYGEFPKCITRNIYVSAEF